MKKETIKSKQKRFNALFKRIMKDLKENNATFVAIPDPTTQKMRVVMVEQTEADEYFKLVEEQVKNQIKEQLESQGDPISPSKEDAKHPNEETKDSGKAEVKEELSQEVQPIQV